LKEQGLITGSTLRATLLQQLAWRALAACCVFMIGFSTMGFSMTSARATSATVTEGVKISKRSTPEGDVTLASIDRNVAVPKASRYPNLFGTSETRSADISPFTKFTAISARLGGVALPNALSSEDGASELDKVEAVNTFYNKIRYIEDKNNYGTSDYWATPAEFSSKGGDCEDYAIAKYTALKNLGFSENQMRIAIVQDTWKGIPHAILIVYTSDGAKFLDNQYKTVKNVEGFTRYRPIYSINRTGWWRHVG
jgi:predicted transglutaminase-like cysteine proteinase